MYSNSDIPNSMQNEVWNLSKAKKKTKNLVPGNSSEQSSDVGCLMSVETSTFSTG